MTMLFQLMQAVLFGSNYTFRSIHLSFLFNALYLLFYTKNLVIFILTFLVTIVNYKCYNISKNKRQVMQMYIFIVNPHARSGLGHVVWDELESILKNAKHTL